MDEIRSAKRPQHRYCSYCHVRYTEFQSTVLVEIAVNVLLNSRKVLWWFQIHRLNCRCQYHGSSSRAVNRRKLIYDFLKLPRIHSRSLKSKTSDDPSKPEGYRTRGLTCLCMYLCPRTEENCLTPAGFFFFFSTGDFCATSLSAECVEMTWQTAVWQQSR